MKCSCQEIELRCRRLDSEAEASTKDFSSPFVASRHEAFAGTETFRPPPIISEHMYTKRVQLDKRKAMKALSKSTAF
jgi:hypothetical protein